MFTMWRVLPSPPPTTAELSTVSGRALVTRTASVSMTTEMPGMGVMGASFMGGDSNRGRYRVYSGEKAS